MPITKEDCLRHIRDLKSEIESHTKAGEYKTAREKEQKLKTWEERLKMLTKDNDATEKLDLSKENETMIDSCTKDDDYTDVYNYISEEGFKYHLKGQKTPPLSQMRSIALSKFPKIDRATLEKALKRFYTADDCGEKIFTEGAKDEDPDVKYKNFMAGKKKPLTYSEGKKLLEEAKKAGIHPDYLKGMERGLSSLSKDDAAVIEANAIIKLTGGVM